MLGSGVDYSYTGSGQSYTVPAGVTKISIRLTGAGAGKGGNDVNIGGNPGPAGQVSGTLDVLAGDVLTFYLGSRGADGQPSSGGGAGAPGNDGGYPDADLSGG
ncbi:MAG: hypothetical protein EBZ81_15010, partial [Betaproteobacteria bacterium]|nr:hypothetical protein [Betaproteobacteria bacterium]